MANETWSHAMLYEVFATAEGVSLRSLDDGSDSMVENPDYRTVAERVQECLDHGLISDSAFTNDYTTANQLMYQGKAAMSLQDFVPITEHYNNMGDTFGWIPYSAFYPADQVTVDSDYTVAGGPMPDDGPAVSAQSENPALAAEWAVQYTLEKLNISYQLGYSPQVTTDEIEMEVEANPVMNAYMEFF